VIAEFGQFCGQAGSRQETASQAERAAKELLKSEKEMRFISTIASHTTSRIIQIPLS
jgi:hypothetical protein